ncbi:IPExxxVDY family protein [Fulvivirgaceae bacterium BMA10]|uniref:IPExxxVDY family protein n=1 Tax=Splendidivirga corallicola TaxID=3051826 RepID=A0ABT8KQX6_9BACT|nr:IPExxxVDY family protein [Fulvivirgaceae bacterium BMA10]
MKRNRLIVEFEYDFKLFGLISTASEHRLAWEINSALGIKLVRQEDIELKFIDNKNLIISNFIFGKEPSIFRLLKNKSLGISNTSNLYLLPEIKQFDYLILIQGFEQSFDIREVVDKLNNVGIIQYTVSIELEKLKSKENLIF